MLVLTAHLARFILQLIAQAVLRDNNITSRKLLCVVRDAAGQGNKPHRSEIVVAAVEAKWNLRSTRTRVNMSEMNHDRRE